MSWAGAEMIWAGAEMIWAGALRSRKYSYLLNNAKKVKFDGPTDGRTDGRMDGPTQ